MSLDDSSRTEGYFDGFGAGQELGRVEGRAEGEQLGIEKSRKETAIAMLKEGMPIELAAKISMLSVDEVLKLKAILYI